jgi:hypothetical protein
MPATGCCVFSDQEMGPLAGSTFAWREKIQGWWFVCAIADRSTQHRRWFATEFFKICLTRNVLKPP